LQILQTPYRLASIATRASSAGIQSSQTWKKPVSVASPTGFSILTLMRIIFSTHGGYSYG
jgi:hypothetical protein